MAKLLVDLDDDAGTNGTAAFTDSEAEALLDSDRGDQLDLHVDVIAMFVKSYMDLGGHQMQINAVNRERLLDAQKHPENYRNLIVRVWGWSGYFVELNEVYQNHIIKRTEMIL